MTLEGVEKVRGIRPEKYILICVENKGENLPNTDIFVIDHDSVDLGERKFLKAIQILKQCQKDDRWPVNIRKDEYLRLPPYRLRELEKLREEELESFVEEITYAS